MRLRHPLALFFAIAYGISWLLWAPLWLPALGVEGLPRLPYHHAFGALGPIGAAFLVAAMEYGRAGPRELLRRMGLWHGRIAWVAVALLAPLVLVVAVALGVSLFGGAHSALAGLGRSSEFPKWSIVGFLAYNMVTFGYGEEVGWRGFALPRLQARHTALVATLGLTVAWAGWHAPLFLYRPGYMAMGLGGIAGWAFSLLSGSVLLTWLYNESRGSLLVVALFHASVDVAFTSDISAPAIVNGSGVLVTLWGIIVLVLAGPRFLSRRGKVVWTDQDPVARLVDREGGLESGMGGS